MTPDPRAAAYDDLHHGQLAEEAAANHASAVKLLGILFEYVRPRSLLDVGCGLGTWLAVARELGVADVYGMEGTWLDRTKLVVDPGLVTTCDLERGVSLGRTFDLAVCLE